MKLTKSEIKLLKSFAKKLPDTFQDGEVWRSIIGADLLKAGHETVNDKPIDPNKFYKIQVSEQIPVNHYRRLLTAFKNGGMAAIEKYTEDVIQLVQTKTDFEFQKPIGWL